MVQKYLMSLVLTGYPNTIWTNDRIDWLLYGNSLAGQQIVFSETFKIQEDDLVNNKIIYCSQALW